MSRCIRLTLALLAILSVNAQSRILVVPDEYPTLQAASDDAVPGDTIGVQAGDHYGDQVPIRSGVTLLGLAGDSTAVRILPLQHSQPINCEGGDHPTIIEAVEIHGAHGGTYGSTILRNSNENLKIRNCSLVAGCNVSGGEGMLLQALADLEIDNCRVTCPESVPVVMFYSSRNIEPCTWTMTDCLFTYVYTGQWNGVRPTAGNAPDSRIVFRNCTIPWEFLAVAGQYSDYTLEVVNCIVETMFTGYNDPPEPGDLPDTFELRYNDFLTTEWGPCEQCGNQIGNFTADPLFCDETADDYRIQADSPCRGAGENGEVVGARLGYCYPYSEVHDGEGHDLTGFISVPPFPNPTPGSLQFELAASQSGHIHVNVLSVTGAVVWSRTVAGGSSETVFRWDGRDSSGALAPTGGYFVRATASDGWQEVAGPVMIIR